MKVLLVAQKDWAYAGYTLSRCLESVGVSADMLIGSLRQNNRPGCGIHFTDVNQVRKYAEEADIIQFMQGQWVNTGVDLSTKRVFVYYGGSNYRAQPKKLSNIFNPIVEKSIIQTADLFGLGAKNEIWLLPAVDLNKLNPVYDKHNDKIIIGHYPSKAAVKNTKSINKIINELKSKFGDRFKYEHTTKMVSWDKHIERVARCDIYVEACSPTQKFMGKTLKYGEWGITGLEAAALGKVVVTHFLSHERYAREYGKHELMVANTLPDIKKHLIELLTLTEAELLQRRKDTRAWVEKFHSYEAVGKRLKEEVYEI